MRTLVILNPAAGGATAARDRRSRIIETGADLAITTGPGHAVDLALEAALSGYDRVLAAGGDGTVRDVAEGLYRAGGHSVLGLLPVGTGNDLARALGIPPGIREAAALASRGRTAPLDLIEARRVGDDGACRYSTNVTVAGFCGRIADRMSAAFRRRLRPLAYPLAALGQVRDLRPYDVKLQVDGMSLEIRALMVVIANGRYAGGNIRLAPGALPDDGKLDLIVIRAVSPARLVTLIPRVLSGRHVGRPGVLETRAREVVLASDPPMWLNLDGDTWHDAPAGFRVLPGALRVLVP